MCTLNLVIPSYFPVTNWPPQFAFSCRVPNVCLSRYQGEFGAEKWLAGKRLSACPNTSAKHEKKNRIKINIKIELDLSDHELLARITLIC